MATPTPATEPSLGEWAALAVVATGPTHGWAITKRLAADGDIGRIWQQSRPLTYRSLDLLTERGWVEVVGEEPSRSGPPRTILAITPDGKDELSIWLQLPVNAVRDLRAALLLKLRFAADLGVDLDPMLAEQRLIVEQHHTRLRSQLAESPTDHVLQWRTEMTAAAERFVTALDSIAAAGQSTV